MNDDMLLEIKNLEFSFKIYAGEVHAVRNISFSVKKGEVLGIIGESGCGKSVTAKAITKLNPMPPGILKNGNIIYKGVDITNYTDKKLHSIRSKEIKMIFQDPMTSLNPTMKVGKQIVEALLKSGKYTKAEAREKTIDMLNLVGLPNPRLRYKQFPHEYSGGMRQRAMIALAMIVDPGLLIADEPTTALDVTTQAQILGLMKDIQNKFNTSIIMITHDLGVIANISDRVVVMYAGKIMEKGTVDDIFKEAEHPYTWGLLKSVPNPQLKRKENLKPIEGTPPDLFAPPKGCPFFPRCKYRMKICKEYHPDETKLSESHSVYCWLLHSYAPKVKNPITEGISYSEK